MSRSSPIVLFLAAVALGGCASSGAVKAAERGDYGSLRQILDGDWKSRKLDGGEARAVAKAVASREIATAKGDDAVKRVDEVRMCAAKVEDALAERAKTPDDAGAEAAYVLVDAHVEKPGTFRKAARSRGGAWRVVEARGLVGAENGEARRAMMIDLDPKVRRAAIEASADEPDRADESVLSETVRVDPDVQARVYAARALGSLGTRDAILALKDRWAAADETLRAAIAQAWADPASYPNGGREELVWVAETQHGVPAITAASALVARGGAEAVVGSAAIVRAIETGSAPSRIVAINLATLANADQKAAIEKAAEEQDDQVKVAALGKLAIDPAWRDKAIAALEPIAASGSPAKNSARSALAELGDRRVVDLLAEDETASEPGVRAWAAGELARMKEWPRAARALADDDASVRTRAACAILAVPK